MKYTKYNSLIIHLIQILQSQKTKAEIDTGNTIEYDVTSYQVKNTIVKVQQYNSNNCNLNAHRETCWQSQRGSDVYNTPITNNPQSKD